MRFQCRIFISTMYLCMSLFQSLLTLSPALCFRPLSPVLAPSSGSPIFFNTREKDCPGSLGTRLIRATLDSVWLRQCVPYPLIPLILYSCIYRKNNWLGIPGAADIKACGDYGATKVLLTLCPPSLPPSHPPSLLPPSLPPSLPTLPWVRVWNTYVT